MDANEPVKGAAVGTRRFVAASDRAKRGIGLTTALALLLGLIVLFPQQAAADDPPPPPPATEPATPEPDPITPLSNETRGAVTRILRLPDTATVVVLPAAEARARIDAALDELERRAEEARRAEQARQAKAVEAQQRIIRTQQVQQQQVVQRQQAQAHAAAKAQSAKAQADAKLKEALEALAKALSTSQCSTVGGTNGQPASISCPMPDGSQASVSGDENVQVTPPTPAAQQAATPTPAPSPALNPGAPEAAVLGSTAEFVAPTPSGPQ